MSNPVPYLYSILRLVPDLDRGEAINIGLVMFCRPQRFLKLEFELDEGRITGFSPQVDLVNLDSKLETLRKVAAADATGGPVAALDIGERFHWLTNVSNTIIQPGFTHPGLTENASATFDRLFAKLVRTPDSGSVGR